MEGWNLISGEQIEQLRTGYKEIKMENLILKREIKNPTVPIWAKEALQSYKDAGYNIDERGHSMDFYRIITLLHQKKLL